MGVLGNPQSSDRSRLRGEAETSTARAQCDQFSVNRIIITSSLLHHPNPFHHHYFINYFHMLFLHFYVITLYIFYGSWPCLPFVKFRKDAFVHV